MARKPERERGTETFLTLNNNGALVVQGNVANDRHPETGAAGVATAGPVNAVEPLENSVEVSLRDSDAFIADLYVDTVIGRLAPDLQAPAKMGVLDPVVDEVAQRRYQLTRIAVHLEP